MSSPRVEHMSTLLAAICAVMLTGQMPLHPESECACQPLDIDAKPKLIVPLYRAYPRVLRVWKQDVFRGVEGFEVGAFLRSSFGLGWDVYKCDNFLRMQVMPSTVQVASALHLAKNDSAEAEKMLNNRPGMGTFRAANAIADRYHIYSGLVTSLWRFPGNADRIWFALREEMKQRTEELQESGL